MRPGVRAARVGFVHLLPVVLNHLSRANCSTDADVSLGDKEIAQAVDEAGRIVVKLRRGRFGGKIKESSGPRAFDPLDDVDDTKSSKEVVYKHNVSHVTTYGCAEVSRIRSSSLTEARHVPLRPAPEASLPRPGAYAREWIRADGPEGNSIVFTIRYRSRGKCCLAHLSPFLSLTPLQQLLSPLALRTMLMMRPRHPGQLFPLARHSTLLIVVPQPISRVCWVHSRYLSLRA